jgi:hypothetical protein
MMQSGIEGKIAHIERTYRATDPCISEIDLETHESDCQVVISEVVLHRSSALFFAPKRVDKFRAIENVLPLVLRRSLIAVESGRNDVVRFC